MFESAFERDDFPLFQNQRISRVHWQNHNKLRGAIRDGNKALVQSLIETGVPVNGNRDIFSIGNTPLHLAVISRSYDIVKLLLDSGADIGLYSRHLLLRDTPLTLAAKVEDTSLVDLILSYNIDNRWNGDSLGHLHIASMRNKVNVVKKLLLMKRGDSDINRSVRNESMYWAGYTPLHFAAHYGCIEVAEFLLKCGADITKNDSRQLTPLHLAHLHRNERVIDLILEAHKSVFTNPTNAEGLSHFHIACTRDNASAVQHFLDMGVDINLMNASNWRPIFFALYYECPNTVKILLGQNASLTNKSSSDQYFSDLLRHAFISGNDAIYNSVVEGKTTPKAGNEYVRELSPFYEACAQNKVERISEILTASDNIHILNKRLHNGSTPLHLAVRYKAENVMQFLLGHKVDIIVQDDDGKTPLHVAFENGQAGMLDTLIKSLSDGAENVTDNVDLSVFHILCASRYPNLVIIKSMLSKGVDVNAQVGSQSAFWAGYTPLHFALEHGWPRVSKIIDLLLKYGADVSIPNALNSNPLELFAHNLDAHYKLDFEKFSSKIIMSLLSSPSAKKRKFSELGIFPLHALCMDPTTDLQLLRQYLSEHPDEINQAIRLPQSYNYHTNTPLHISMDRRDFKQSKLLLEYGAQHLVMNTFGQTPLELSVKYRMWEESSILELESLFTLEKSFKFLKPSHFHIACVFGLSNVVKYVLDNMVDEKLRMTYLNCRDDSGRTHVHSMLLHGTVGESQHKQKILHMLLANGADVDAKDFELQTILHSAQLQHDVEYIRIILNNGADVNAQNIYGQTPLHVTLLWDEKSHSIKDKIALLLEYGADINITDELGQACLKYVEEFHQENDYFIDCLLPLMQHVKKLEVIGYLISDLNKAAYTSLQSNFNVDFDEKAFLKKCKKEVELMKSTNIDRYATLHDILFKSMNEMSCYCENVDLLALIDSCDFSEKFSNYGYLVKLQLKNGKKRRPLLEKSKASFIHLIKSGLPQACIETILEYLSNRDLKNIIMSTENTK